MYANVYVKLSYTIKYTTTELSLGTVHRGARLSPGCQQLYSGSLSRGVMIMHVLSGYMTPRGSIPIRQRTSLVKPVTGITW